MALIPKKNLDYLLEAQIVPFQLTIALPFPSLPPLFCLFFLIFTFTTQFIPTVKPLSYACQLILPITFSIFTRRPQDLNKILQNFDHYSFICLYTQFLTLHALTVFTDPLIQFCVLGSVQTLLYLVPWQELSKCFIVDTWIPQICICFHGILSIQTAFAPNWEHFYFPLCFAFFLGVFVVLLYFYSIFYFVFLTKDSGKFVEMVPLLMLNLNLFLWIKSEVFIQWPVVCLIIHSLLFTLVSFKFKIFTAAKVPLAYSQLEIVLETFFLVQEFSYRVIPRHPTLAILLFFIVTRATSVYLLIRKQLKSLKFR